MKQKITINAKEIIERKVKPIGNGAYVMIPKAYINKVVTIILK